MEIIIVGNIDLPEDALPLRLLPRLKSAFPALRFRSLDPNEEWDLKKAFVLIDTVVGISAPMIFSSLKAFMSTPRITMHDFDALSQLRFLEKLGKVPQIKIIGVPPMMNETEALTKVSNLLKELTLPGGV